MKVRVHVVRAAGECRVETAVEVDLELPMTDEFTLDELMVALLRAAHAGIEVSR